MALLRASSTALGITIDLDAALDDGTGVLHGRTLLDFAEAAHRGAPELPDTRRAVVEAVGVAGLVDACLTVSAFNGLTRVADATGIVLDGGTLTATSDARERLGLNDFSGARNTPHAKDVVGAPVLLDDVRQLFAD